MRCPACGRESERLVAVNVAVGLGSTVAFACPACAKPIYTNPDGTRSLTRKAQDGEQLMPATEPCSRCGLSLEWHVPFDGRPANWRNACCGWKR